jgi:hypothetical protein
MHVPSRKEEGRKVPSPISTAWNKITEDVHLFSFISFKLNSPQIGSLGNEK